MPKEEQVKNEKIDRTMLMVNCKNCMQMAHSVCGQEGKVTEMEMIQENENKPGGGRAELWFDSMPSSGQMAWPVESRCSGLVRCTE